MSNSIRVTSVVTLYFWIKDMIRNCTVCKKEFDSKFAGSKYCSAICKKEALSLVCESCGKTFNRERRCKRRFCSLKCATGRPRKEKCNISVCKMCGTEFDNRYNPNRIYCSRKCVGLSCRGHNHGIKIWNSKQHRDIPSTIWDMEFSTRSEIMKRMKLACSRCGWNKCVCDLHHIRGRKIQDPHNQNNLCCLCPNCHREAGRGLIPIEELITFQEYVGDLWKSYYYG